MTTPDPKPSRCLRPLQIGALAFFVSCVWAPQAQAQDEEARANARAAAHAGADAFDAGEYGEAIKFFERAESQFHSPVHLWYVARAAQSAGQFVKAREACLKVAREGAPEGASDAVVQANTECGQILEDLRDKIATLTINVEGAPSSAEYKVFRNGLAVPKAIIGIPAPLDPGQHAFTVTADGYTAEGQKLTIAPGEKNSITLTLVAADQATQTEGANALSRTESTPESAGGLPKPYWPAFVAWGAGLGGIGAGVYFGLSGSGKASEADELCGGSRDECRLNAGDSDARRVNELNDQAGSSQIMSLVGYGAGGALVATGVVLWLLEVGGNSSAESARKQDFYPVLGPSHVGFRGSF